MQTQRDRRDKTTRLDSPAREARRLRRLHDRPRVTFPDDLPVVLKRTEIAKAISENQVVILCGETGSGKTTQLPKICLEIGRGIDGMIGHTQPRRIAARSVAARIADELQSAIGQAVGYKIRFGDRTGENTYIKVMTDGILLAEIQSDRLLRQYDTLIIDEAHERTLNIDFLLGYLKQLLPQRPDLKVIVTSATIDPQRFSRHFDNAPIIMVSGRTYAVEVRYRPVKSDDPDEEDREQTHAIVDAVAELSEHSSGDVLVFLSGEREIREAAEELSKHHPPQTEILPLYARLSAAEQARIFQPHGNRRIVLATNVAETSLTVPGIKYVIDTGFARISQYSARTKVQRLPIEPISQASADQRKGRCGRVSEGICIRLYSQEDFASRAQFTEPEILRTNLASVILQMKTARLGEIEHFPFLERPDSRLIRDGYLTLHELGAVDDLNELTPIGRQLGKLPVDPRIGRMIIEGDRENCLSEVLIIAAALSVQDPRDRPVEMQQMADEAHRQFIDPASDFLGYLNMWDFYREKSKHLSNSQLRKQIRQQFLSYLRMREWYEVHQQIHTVVTEMGFKARTPSPGTLGEGRHLSPSPSAPGRGQHLSPSSGPQGQGRHLSPSPSPPGQGQHLSPSPGTPGGGRGEGDFTHRTTPDKPNHPNPLPEYREREPRRNADRITRALLTGLLSNVGNKTDTNEYAGLRGAKFNLFPGSVLFQQKPKWVMAAELVETNRLYARTVAKILPEWIERAAAHLIKKTYNDPQWSSQRGDVIAGERVSLKGLILVPHRTVCYGPIDPRTSREVFIHYALVEGDFRTSAPFFKHNRELLAYVQTLEAKLRRGDLHADPQKRFAFYNSRIPPGIYNTILFDRWRREAEKTDPRILFMAMSDVAKPEVASLPASEFPDELSLGNLKIELSYLHDTGSPQDGITANIPLAILNQVPAAPFEWLVPGWLNEKVVEMIRTLPKPIRTKLVPAPESAAKALAAIGLAPSPGIPGDSQHLSHFAGTAGDNQHLSPSPGTPGDSQHLSPSPRTTGDIQHLSPFAGTAGDIQHLSPSPRTTGDIQHLSPFAGTAGDIQHLSPSPGTARDIQHLSPSPGTPGEGRGEGDFVNRPTPDKPNRHHPNPLPEYRERGAEKARNLPFLPTIAFQLGRLIGETIPPQSFDLSAIPQWLRINFRVLDGSGKSLATGRDLIALRTQLGIQARESFASLPPSQYTQDGLKSWDFGDLPERIEIHRGSTAFSGFPAVIDQGAAVGLRVLDSREASIHANRVGVRRLFMIQLGSELKQLARGLTHVEEMSLLFKPLGSWAELREDLLAAAVDRSLFNPAEDIRSREVFINKARDGWNRLSVATRELNTIAYETLQAYGQANLALDRKFPEFLEGPATEMREQLKKLTPKTFLSSTPIDWLQHLPRYLKAVSIRATKLLNAGLRRDLEITAQIRPLSAEYTRLRNLHAARGLLDPELSRLWWMIQELRVSLYAQELKTIFPVSVQRVEKQIALIQK